MEGNTVNDRALVDTQINPGGNVIVLIALITLEFAQIKIRLTHILPGGRSWVLDQDDVQIRTIGHRELLKPNDLLLALLKSRCRARANVETVGADKFGSFAHWCFSS